MPSYRITRVYVVKGDTKSGARRTIADALASGAADPDEYLDFESIREVAPDEQAGSFVRQIAREAKSQLLGRGEPAQQPARGNGHA